MKQERDILELLLKRVSDLESELSGVKEDIETNTGGIESLVETCSDTSVTLSPSGVVAGTYGSSLAIPQFTVDSTGVLVFATENDISTVNATVTFADNGTVDAFGRLRVSNPVGRFSSQFEYGKHPLLWQEWVSGGGTSTHLPNESSIRLRCGTASGDKVTRQTFEYFRYQPGKSQLVELTGIIGAVKADSRKRIGMFDDDNGIFFECNETSMAVVNRTYTSGSAVDNSVAQASWNLDVMDGTGTSGLTLDWAKTQIFFFDVEWLGVGRVRMGFVVDGKRYYCHEFLNTNNLILVYATTMNLPLRYEIENTGTTASQTDLKQICCQVSSEGGVEEDAGFPFSASNGVTTIPVSTRRPVLSIRPKSTFGGKTTRGLIIPGSVDIYSSQAAFIEIVYGGALTGASFNSASANSQVEFDVAATAISGGEIVHESLVSGASTRDDAMFSKDIGSRMPITLDYAGANPITLSVVSTKIAVLAADTSASIGWREIY